MSDSSALVEKALANSEERKVIFSVLDSFRQYRRSSHYNVTHRRRQNFYALPSNQWHMLASPPFNLLDILNAVDDALDANADFADAILDVALRHFGLPNEPVRDSGEDWQDTAKPSDMVKVHSTIRQFYRDWSNEGFINEVQPLLQVVLTDLASTGLKPGEERGTLSLLLPGAGLGRIMFEMALRGYDVEGNEISYHQLLASHFILNATTDFQQYRLYPFASTFTNHKLREDQLRSVSIPDVHPGTLASQHTGEHVNIGNMKMTAGDFITTYSSDQSANHYHGVVSLYFVDTAPNLIRYIRTVANCLKPGGIWINIGPLLWHFDDRRVEPYLNEHGAVSSFRDNDPTASSLNDTGIAEPGSFELSDNEVLLLVERMGFEIIKHEYIATTHGGYVQDRKSMMQNRYECSHWVARKLP